MDVAEFQRQLALLQREHQEAGSANPGSYRSRECVRCVSCIFCDRCVDCYKCTYCVQCGACSSCSHSVDCQSCHGCAYCVQSTNCTSSAYLVACHACAECTYCFGCVGLVRKEFHLLNVPYGRDEYFALTRQLAAALRLPATP